MIITASMCALGGLLAAAGIRNPPRPETHPFVKRHSERTHCALDAPPLDHD
jgi:hypothetical protein